MGEILTVIVGIAVIIVFVWAMKKTRKVQPHFDEMQLQLRAKGYAAAYVTTLIGMGSFMLLYETGKIDFIDPAVCFMAVLMASVAVFAVYCIRHEAFFSIGEKGNYYMLLCAAVVVLNGISAATSIAGGGLMKDGRITFSGGAANVLTGLTFLAVFIALLVKKLGRGSEADE